jgi:GNAT superfamily N-acetyltransferase
VSAPTLRPVSSDDDLERIAHLKALIDPILESTVEEIRFLTERLGGALLLLAEAEGEPAGFGLVGVFSEQEEEPFAYTEIGVAPDFQGRGVGAALHAALSAHARDLGKSELLLEVGEEDSGAISFLEKRGYREVERQKAVALDLTELDTVSVEPPPGVEIKSWVERPDLAPAMFELYREANADIPGLDAEGETTFKDWRVRELERPARRHDLSFVALAGDELVGYATLDVFPAGGFHGLTAVARAWRRRGVGRALKRSQIAAAKAAGLEKLYTESEERNEPMRRLNEELGFRPIPGMVVMRGPLVS